ncbi:HAMP domain-containing sensor histidine kinase [Kitasatospora sp. NPDC051914]|uniref:sensor histidine kinase n=1 Tax=Kitasatospora sp. NPDC051914 TaxID=3154945 RepID=UPI0034242C11
MKAVGRLTGWFRGRSLRSRLAVLTAAAVAVAIALSALACWFLVRDRLYQQVKDNLRAAPYDFRTIANGQLTGDTLPNCGTTPQQALTKSLATKALFDATHPDRGGPERGGGPNRWDNQLVTATGAVCLPIGATKAIETDPADRSILTAPDNTVRFRDGAFVSGRPAMVRVSKVYIVQSQEPAIMLTAQDITGVQDSLRQLAYILAGVAAAGVVGAGFTGRIVARSALKPVDRLSDAVEHIARTEEVGTTIPVHGKDEIARLSTSFNSMSTALLNSRERQTRLIADAGHELRTPLTSLRTNVDLLIRSDETGRPLPADTRTRLLGNMKAQMQELTLLIGDLLQLSRPDSPKPGQNLAVVALHEIAGRAVERARLRGPGLVFNLAVHPWYVHGDAAALERAVINLLDNAVKYSPPGGAVDVSLIDGRLTVRDHGPGIPQDELQYVFDRFWRSPSSRQLPGSGLGLSIVAQTVRDTGGEVALGPAADGGPGALASVVLPGQPDRPE